MKIGEESFPAAVFYNDGRSIINSLHSRYFVLNLIRKIETFNLIKNKMSSKYNFIFLLIFL